MFYNFSIVYDFIDFSRKGIKKSLPQSLFMMNRRKRAEASWHNRVVDTTEADNQVTNRFREIGYWYPSGVSKVASRINDFTLQTAKLSWESDLH